MANHASPLPCVEVGPPDAESAVVWLHGLGASGHDFEPIVPMLGLPRTRFVFPHAPRRAVTINMGFVMPAWYDILTLDHRAGLREPEAHVLEAQAHVEVLLARERERGVPSSRTVLAGFSQGGAVALFSGVRHAHPLAGIMVLSAYELLADRAAEDDRGGDAANAGTPALFCHGSRDPMVPPWRGKAAYEALAARAQTPDQVRWHEFPMGHEVCPEEIEVIATWLRARLGSR